MRNLSPVVQLYGMPRMLGARTIDGDFEASMNMEIANNFQSDLVDGKFGFFDGETYVTSYRFRDDIGERWEWGVEVPWVVHTPGSLDGLVDEFHELFGLPDGERSLAPRGRLDYYVGDNGLVYADFSDSRQSLGDVRGFLGLELMDNRMGALSVRTQVKFATGTVEDLSGSEGTDVSVWGEYEYAVPFNRGMMRLSVAGGITHLGEGELFPEHQETWMHFAHLGLQIPLGSRLEFHAQLDAHSRPLNTGNPLLADGGVLGTLGGRFGISDRLWVDLAIIEDLEAESASDVVFQILMGWRL